MSGPVLRVAIVSVGDELLAGDIVDTNAAEIARACRAVGVLLSSVRVVGDVVEVIARAVTDAAAEAPFVVVTGGLGPTKDDLTRDGLARAAGVPLVEDADAARAVAALFARIGRPMSSSNLLQALRPATARCLDNPIGTAPGINLPLARSRVFALPGPPSEMRRMLADHVLPAMGATGVTGGGAIERVKLRAHGLPESVAGECLAEFMGEGADPQVGITVSRGILTVTITARGADAAAAERVRAVAAEAERRLAPSVFGRDGETIEEAVLAAARAAGERIAVAESCTGGRIAALLTRVAGSSEVFVEGIVTYANSSKIARLGVHTGTLAAHGAVSAEVAREMVEGLARATGAASLSVTGIAGPGGATPDKPVGLVFVGVSVAGVTETHRYQFVGDRETIQSRAASAALDRLRLALVARRARA